MSTLIKTDPICGMVVESEATSLTYTYVGWTYLFCCADCLEAFQRAPEAYVTYLAHSRSVHVGHRCSYPKVALLPHAQGVSS